MSHAPALQVQVTSANSSMSVRAIPDTAADLCDAGLEFLQLFDESQDNLCPSSDHPQTANGTAMMAIGKLHVTFELGMEFVSLFVHIIADVQGLLLSWQVVRDLALVPATYPEQILQLEVSPGSRSG